MPDLRPYPRGRYFEDFTRGERIVTASRTVTESDVLSFAGLTADYNPIHTDAVLAATTPFGQRVAHGALGLSLAIGLAARTGMMEGRSSPSARSKNGSSGCPCSWGIRFMRTSRSTSSSLSPSSGGEPLS